MFISVIIPTYNRKEVLRDTLVSLCEQTHPVTEYEIVVVDDGSSDGTGEMVGALRLPCSLRYFRQPNKGPAGARNLGAANARGELIIFLDDDIAADSHFLEEHAKYHRTYADVIVIGAIKLSPQVKSTAFAEVGTLNQGYLAGIVDETGLVPPEHCMIGNLSLRKADFLRVGSLDDDYFGGGGWSGWEDIDFGYRAAQNGLRIRYNPNAVGYHNDYAATDLKACCRRMRIASRVAPILFKKHPGLKDSIAMFHDKGYISWRDDPPNIVLRKLARSIMIRPPARKALEVVTGVVEALWPSPALLRPLYRWVIGTYICLGYREGLKARRG